MRAHTAHSKEEFGKLLLELPSLTEELNSTKKASEALHMYLMKIRTGQSNESIGSLFGVSRTTVQRRCDIVRKLMKQTIVPRYINYERSRDELISRKSIASRLFFDDGNEQSAHLILDGTYIFLEKSQSHEFQKNTYNTHKKRNYLKIMMGVSTDGTIIFTLGPFKAKENDAQITRKIFDSEMGSTRAYLPQDIMIVDRGFRDCVTDLKNRGFIVKMPVCSTVAQLTTQEANQSRLVTKVRYEVERVNGVMKNVWRIFAGVVETQYIPHVMTDFEIGAALINRQSKPRTIDEDKCTIMANSMLSRLNIGNHLQNIVNGRSFERMINAQSYQLIENIETVPPLTFEDLEKIAFGQYQIVQARCYLSNQLSNQCLSVYSFFKEDIDKHFSMIFESTEDLILLMTNLKSRFVSNRVHRVFVLRDKSKLGVDSVLQYCCDCKVGSRTVGCCSHVMSLLYHVSYAPSIGGVTRIASHLDGVFENNNYHGIEEDSDEE